MTVLADLIGELSWGLKAAWIAWAAWIAIQVVWRRRGRIEVSLEAPISVRVDRLTLGLNARPGAMSQRRIARPSERAVVATEDQPEAPVQPEAASTVVDAIDVSMEPTEAPLEEPVRAPKRPKRRRQSARQEAASAATA